jgi:hypothetical protein
MPKRRERARSSSGARAEADPRLRALYAVEPGAFVGARDALARTLAAEGDPEAERVRRLRRPTGPVWLLNAIARERPRVVEALLAAADGLRRAQVRALAGEGAALREATAAMHDAVVEVLAAARQLSAGRGREPSAATLGEVERGARALATDPGARQALREGILDRLPEAGGAELLSGLAVVPVERAPADRGAAAPGPRPHRRGRGDGGGSVSRRAEAARRSAERRRAAAAAKHARAVAAAEGRVRAAEARARTAEERVRDATRLLEDARRHVAAARKDAEAVRAAAPREPRG